MTNRFLMFALVLTLASCGRIGGMFDRDDPPAPAPAAASDIVAAEGTDAPDAPAETAGPDASGLLGTTVASLGSPADPGLWLSTPLVTSVRAGRLVYPATGQSVEVELRPSGGAAGSGSQASIQALQGLGAPITGLPEIEVYAL